MGEPLAEKSRVPAPDSLLKSDEVRPVEEKLCQAPGWPLPGPSATTKSFGEVKRAGPFERETMSYLTRASRAADKFDVERTINRSERPVH